MADASIFARFDGTRELALRFDRATVQHDLERTVGEVGDDAREAFATVAPRDTGRLADGIRFRRTGVLSGEVLSTARNPTSGYPYTGVTRFGHGVIVPKAGRRAATVIETRTLRVSRAGAGRRPALRFVIGGRVVYAARVKAWKPPGGDWAEHADEPIRLAVDRRMSELKDRLLRQLAGP